MSAVPNDVGILFLESEAQVPSMPMNTSPIESLSLLGTEVRIVGYGSTGRELADNGTRLQGTMLLESVDGSNTYSTAFPGASCPGDSGGALLAMIDGVETLIGITSRGNCGSTSIHERVDSHFDEFITPFIDDPFEASCDEDLKCASGCAAPDPDCPCADDGFCDDDCDDIATDVDCSATCTALDGVCGAECEFADLDCLCVDDGICGEVACLEIDPDCTDDGRCGCQSGGTGGAALLVMLALLGLRRRFTLGRGA